jgi:AcrR family transcriptional regulator
MSTMTKSKRERLLDAMLAEVAEKGYRETELESAMRRAGIEGEDFATEFADKDACLEAAYERLTERLIERATGQCDPAVDWTERVRYGLEALLGEFAAEPEMARTLTRSFPSIRPETYRRYMSFLEAFAPFFTEGRELSAATEELPGEVEMLAVGAAEAIILEEIEAGRSSQLPSLMPSILFSLLVPFIGPDRAADEMRRAAGAGS